MKLPTRDSQTGSPNALTLSGSILLAGVVFKVITAYWLFASIPLLMIGFTAESRLKDR